MTSDPIETNLLKARVRLLMEQPLFAQLALNLEFVDATSWCPTAATNGEKLFYNRDFLNKLSPAELMFVIGHEILHCVLDHLYRRGDRETLVYNMAADYIVNYVLVKADIGEKPSTALYDPRYSDEYSVEQLYALLLKENVQPQDTIDLHLETSDGSGSEDESEDGPPTMSEDQIHEMRKNIRNLLVQSAQSIGSMPLGVSRLLSKLVEPTIDWRQHLTAVLRSHVKHDYTYTRISRRCWHTDLILPGQDVEDCISVVIWLDGSASTTQAMITDFVSECSGIIRSFRDFDLTIGAFDTKPYNVRNFTPQNGHEIESYEMKGGGGTHPSCCWDYMKEQEAPPHKILLFGDGLFGKDWGEEGYADTTFIIHSNPQITAPYGTTIHYNSGPQSR